MYGYIFQKSILYVMICLMADYDDLISDHHFLGSLVSDFNLYVNNMMIIGVSDETSVPF